MKWSSTLCLAVLILSECGWAGEMPDEGAFPNIVKPLITISSTSQKDNENGTGQSLVLPRGAAFINESEVLISDCSKHTIQKYHIDAARKSYKMVGEFGRFGAGRLEFNCPGPIAVSANGDVYIFDVGNSRVEVLDNNFAWRFSFGRYGSEAGEFGVANELFNSAQMVVDKQSIYITDPANHRVQVFNLSGGYKFDFGRKGSQPGEFVYPNGIVIDRAGNIVVADMYNNRLQKFSGDGTFISEWGGFGSYLGELAGPASLALVDGNILVADAVNHRVQIFDSDGKYLYQFGRHPSFHHEGNGRLHYPMIAATDPTGRNIIICEKFEQRCQVFDSKATRDAYVNVTDSAWWDKYPYFHYRTSAQILKGPLKSQANDIKILGKSSDENAEPTWLVMSEEELHRITVMDIKNPKQSYAFGSYGDKIGELKMPQGAHVDQDGNVWVSDTLNDRLQVFSIEGEPLKVIGERGSGPLQFNQPGEMVIDRSGNVYVLDPGNGRIQVLNKKGEFVRQIGKQGQEAGELTYPIGLTLSPNQDRLYVVELYKPRIQEFSTDGKFVKSWGHYGLDDGGIIVACHSATDRMGNVYITDDAASKVTKFNKDGVFVKSWGHLGSGEGEFYHPQGIAVDDTDRIWILDYGNHRGQLFDTEGKFLGYFGDGQIGSDKHLPSVHKEQE